MPTLAGGMINCTLLIVKLERTPGAGALAIVIVMRELAVPRGPTPVVTMLCRRSVEIPLPVTERLGEAPNDTPAGVARSMQNVLPTLRGTPNASATFSVIVMPLMVFVVVAVPPLVTANDFGGPVIAIVVTHALESGFTSTELGRVQLREGRDASARRS